MPTGCDTACFVEVMGWGLGVTYGLGLIVYGLACKLCKTKDLVRIQALEPTIIKQKKH